jgi:hypothetical protein
MIRKKTKKKKTKKKPNKKKNMKNQKTAQEVMNWRQMSKLGPWPYPLKRIRG